MSTNKSAEQLRALLDSTEDLTAGLTTEDLTAGLSRMFYAPLHVGYEVTLMPIIIKEGQTFDQAFEEWATWDKNTDNGARWRAVDGQEGRVAFDQLIAPGTGCFEDMNDLKAHCVGKYCRIRCMKCEEKRDYKYTRKVRTFMIVDSYPA